MARTHGLRAHPLCSVWSDMKTRCYNSNQKSYKHYGGRGIIVCEEWTGDFKCFYDWAIKNGYKKGLQIDRINNDGNYEPDNCRFVTTAENCRNSRQTKLNWGLVTEIRNAKLLIPQITQQEVADAYSVSRETISKILIGKMWVAQ